MSRACSTDNPSTAAPGGYTRPSVAHRSRPAMAPRGGATDHIVPRRLTRGWSGPRPVAAVAPQAPRATKEPNGATQPPVVGQRVIDSFVLASVHGGTKLEFRGAIPRGLEGYDGTSFVAALVGHPVSASVDVYDIEPHRWSRLFHDMARTGEAGTAPRLKSPLRDIFVCRARRWTRSRPPFVFICGGYDGRRLAG